MTISSEVKFIPISQIKTFDDDHISFGELFIVKPFDSLATLQHRSVIEFIKTQLQHGRKIRPILVRQSGSSADSYERLDGFCRLWAYKELGRKEIPCILGTDKGGQSDLSPFI